MHAAFPVLPGDSLVLRHVDCRHEGRNRLHQIAPQFLTDKTERTLDFSYCLLRMKAAGPTSLTISGAGPG